MRTGASTNLKLSTKDNQTNSPLLRPSAELRSLVCIQICFLRLPEDQLRQNDKENEVKVKQVSPQHVSPDLERDKITTIHCQQFLLQKEV
jgi:hypothetical protein